MNVPFIKKLLSVFSVILTLLLLTSCFESNLLPADTNNTDDTTDAQQGQSANILLMENGVSNYKIIRSDNATQDEIDAAIALNAKIKSLTGKNLAISTDFVFRDQQIDANALEILIGNTNRAESTELMSTLEKNQYAIKTTDTKIVIVGYNDLLLTKGVEYFMETCLAEVNAEFSENNLILKNKVDFLSDSSYSALAETLKSASSFSSNSTILYSIAAPSKDIKTVQGGCSDGTYYYQAFLQRIDVDVKNDEKGNIDRIVKTELATGKVVKTSGDLSLNHCNDITYNARLGKLIVCHNNPYRNKLSLLDPETLEITSSITLDCTIFSIDYCYDKDMYVVGLSGGQSFRFLNANFKLADNEIHQPTNQTSGYVTQGVACDKNLIYFVLYKENVITVYDWDGKFISLITLNIGSIEPENICIIDDVIHVIAARSGATLFSVTPQKITQ